MNSFGCHMATRINNFDYVFIQLKKEKKASKTLWAAQHKTKPNASERTFNDPNK